MRDHIACVFVDGNLDSFTAAWTLWKINPNADFYNDVTCLLPEHIEGRDVFVMGCEVSLEGLIAMAPFTRTLTIFGYEETFVEEYHRLKDTLPANVQVIADTQQSLCQLSWGYFCGSASPPLVFQYLQDRTLWRFQYLNTRAVYTALLSYPLDMETWDQLMALDNLTTLEQEGNIVLRRLTRDIEYIVRQQRRRVDIQGYNVPLVNVNPQLAMDVGMLVSKNEPFAACYWDTPFGRQFELISTCHGVHVGRFATLFGGHGHQREASFKVPRDHPLASC